jgi:hypothetical protein
LHKQEKVTPSQGCEGSAQGRESGFVGTLHGEKKKDHTTENHPHPTLSLKQRVKEKARAKEKKRIEKRRSERKKETKR